MKKFLSLVMALIMAMSLVTVASAADYKDAADIDKAEAVDVMSAVGVFQGSAGKFNPKAVLNRAEAAKLIAYLDLGEDVAEALPAVQSFSDVPATHWAAKYVAYCADEGYINGVGNGKFDPAGKLTGYQFGKLLLCALGYDQKLEAFTGANWSIAVAKLMQSNDINDGVKAAPSAELTREDAAQYCLNALQATTVSYADKGTTITVGGVDIVTGAKAATPVVLGDKGLFDDGTRELAEKLYEDDLVKTDADDAFGRPATKWTYESKEVGTYAETAKFVWTTAMKKDAVTTALKGYVVADSASTTTYKVNADTKLVGSVNLVGKTLNNSKSLAEQIAAFTGNGTLVEIFTKKDTIKEIHVITYNAAEVTKVVTDKDGNVTYSFKDCGSGATFSAKDFADPDTDDTIKAAADMAKDDIVTYVKKGSVYYTYPTTSVTGVVSRVSANDYVVVDGTKYPLATGVGVSVSKNAQKLTIDQYGVVVDADSVKSESKVAYVAKVWEKAGNYGPSTWVQVVTQSGEVVEKQLSTSNGAAVTEGNLYDFYVTSKDTASLLVNTKAEATYKLSASFDSDDKYVTDHASKTYYFTNDVKFVNVKDNGADIKVTTSTGMQKVVTTNVYLVVDDADIEVVFVPAAAKGAVDKSSVLFLATTDIVDNALDKDNKDARVYELYKDGVAVEAMVEDGAPLNASSAAGKFYTYSIDETTGRYALELVSDQYSIYADGSDAAALAIKADKYIDNETGTLYALAKDASFFDLTDNGFETLADVVDFVEVNEDAAFQICFTYDDEEITVLYIVEKSDLA